MLSFPTPTCSEVRRELEALALNQLPARDLEIVRQHLARCAGCLATAKAVADVVGRIQGLARSREASTRHGVPVALLFAASLVLMVALEFRAGSRDAEPRLEDVTWSASVAELVRAQGHDGAWREAGDERSDVRTLGLSALATLGCLGTGDRSPGALAAGQRGCDFLARSVRTGHAGDSAATPDIHLRAQAAAAWALGVAARRWPERYRGAATRALHDLRRLEETWASPDGGLVVDDMTRLLVRSARAHGAEERPARRDRDSDLAAPPRLATRLLADAVCADPGPGGSITRIASRVLADSLPKTAPSLASF